MFNIENFLTVVVAQNADAMRTYLAPDAVVCWHETNEQFTAEEYIRANCEYPGAWTHSIKRTDSLPNGLVVVYLLSSCDEDLEFYVTAFIKLQDGKTTHLDEYYCHCSAAPQWRLDMNIGKPIDPTKASNTKGW